MLKDNVDFLKTSMFDPFINFRMSHKISLKVGEMIHKMFSIY